MLLGHTRLACRLEGRLGACSNEWGRRVRRRERKRLFGGTGQGSGNLRELQDMMAQWQPASTASPADECLGDVFCLAEVGCASDCFH